MPSQTKIAILQQEPAKVLCWICKGHVPKLRQKGMCESCEKELFHGPAKEWVERYGTRKDKREFRERKYIRKERGLRMRWTKPRR